MTSDAVEARLFALRASASEPSSASCERRDVYMDTYDVVMLILALAGLALQIVSIKRK